MNILHFIEKIPLLELEFIEHVGCVLHLPHVQVLQRACLDEFHPVLQLDRGLQILLEPEGISGTHADRDRRSDDPVSGGSLRDA